MVFTHPPAEARQEWFYLAKASDRFYLPSLAIARVPSGSSAGQ